LVLGWTPVYSSAEREVGVSVSADPLIGSVLLEYRIEGVLGRGGMGVVYRAFDPRLKRSVALKLVAPHLSGDESFRERFLRESELAASLEHPNVVPIHEAGEVGGQLYLVMRLVEGSDLKALLAREGTLEPARALTICGQLAAALDTAHERGLVHRDVKPSNVLLDSHDHVYLADFGLTKQLEGPGLPVGQGPSLGTPGYVAPEQIAGGEVDGRADEYSLACLLYECLTGEVPFPRDSELAALWAHINDPPPHLSERRAELPEAIDPVLAKAMAKEPDERYESCAELADAAREALGLGSVVVLRDRRPLFVAAAGVVLAGAALAGFLLNRGGGGPAKPSTKPTLALKTDALQRIDPATNKLVATLRLGSNPTGVAVGGGSVWTIHLDDNRVSKIDPRSGEIVATSTAPGPKAVATGAGSVWIVNGDAGTVTRLDERSAAQTHVVEVPSSTELVAFGDQALWAASPLNGTVTQVNPRSSSVSRSRVIPVRRGALKAVAVGEGAVWISSNDIFAQQYGVFRVDPASGEVLTRIKLRLGALGVVAGEGAVWVANASGNTVSQIEPTTDRVVRTIPVGKDPIAVALGDGSVWVTNYREGTVSRIDPKKGRVVATIRVGPNPDHVAAGEGGVWVTVHPR
jgi:YVTN family beta-propeller protein